jgi:hypothetical protein
MKLHAVISTYGDKGTPHLDVFQKNNPSIECHILYSNEKSNTAWRNCDVFARDWWKVNRFKISATHVLFIEHDVYWNIPIDFEPKDFIARDVFLVGTRKWDWWKEAHNLPKDIQKFSAGCQPFGIRVMSRYALDLLSQPVFDELYSLDMMCELRTPTILNSLGIKLSNFNPPLRGNITCREIKLPKHSVGVFHAIKK